MRQNLGLGLSWCEGKCLLFSASGYFLGLRETRLSGDLSSKWPLAPSGSIWLLGWPRRIVPTYFFFPIPMAFIHVFPSPLWPRFLPTNVASQTSVSP